MVEYEGQQINRRTKLYIDTNISYKQKEMKTVMINTSLLEVYPEQMANSTKQKIS